MNQIYNESYENTSLVKLDCGWVMNTMQMFALK